MKWIVVIGAVLVLPALALGSVRFTLTEHGGSATAIIVERGTSFTIDLGLDQDDADGTAGFALNLVASTDGIFYITGRTLLVADPYELSTDSNLTNDTNKWLSPGTVNIGAMNLDETGYWLASEFPRVVEDITLAIATDAAPGVYTITTGNPGGGIIISDAMGSGAQTGLTNGSIQVIVKSPPVVDTAMSWKSHGTGLGYRGDFGIDVLADRLTGLDIEPRLGGVTKLVVEFDVNIQGSGGGGAAQTSDVALKTSGGSPNGTVSSATIGAAPSNTLTIEMSGTLDAEPLIVEFPGIANASDAGAVCEDSLCIRQMIGDIVYLPAIINMLKIRASDVTPIRNNLNAIVDGTNFRYDLNYANPFGRIQASDVVPIRDRINTNFTGSCD